MSYSDSDSFLRSTPWDNLEKLYSPISKEKEQELASIILSSPNEELYSSTFHTLYFSVTKYIIKLTIDVYFNQHYSMSEIDDLIYLIYKRLYTSTHKYDGTIRYNTFINRNIKSILCYTNKQHNRMKYISIDDNIMEDIINDETHKRKYSDILKIEETPYSIIEHKDILGKISNIFDKLNEKDKDILTSDETITKLGNKYNKSYESIRMRKISLLKKIRKELE